MKNETLCAIVFFLLFATVDGFKPEDVDMIDFESVKIMIDRFNAYHEACEECK